jgi:hypothetical protein
MAKNTHISPGFWLLANTPLAGRACDSILYGYKKFPNGSHIIFDMEVGSQRNALCVFCIKTGMLNRRSLNLVTRSMLKKQTACTPHQYPAPGRIFKINQGNTV